MMKGKIERRARRGLEHRNRRSPMVASRLSGGIGVERRERREIPRVDRASACPVFEQPGKLRPIGCFKSKIFSRDHRTRIGQCAPCYAHVAL